VLSLDKEVHLVRMSLCRWATAALPLVAALLFTSGTARAQTIGAKGQLVIDQLSGFRVTTSGNLDYYGPLGFSTRSFTERDFDNTRTQDVTTHETTFWFAPSADFFVIDHLSVGGLIELATTSSSVNVNTNGASASTSLPGTTDFTFLPRVGWMFNIGERLAIWPRGGLGYISRQHDIPNGTATVTDSFNGFIFDVDVGFLVRFTDGWFIKAAPEISFVPGGSHSSTNNTGVEVSADASTFQFAGVAGIGVYLDL
jgi:hypothetical protein